MAGWIRSLAILREVDAGTQNQALCAILFYCQKVLGRDMQFINRLRAKESTHLPLVMSQREIRILLPEFLGRYEVMARLMYGSGMRHKETRTLRIQDLHFDTGHIFVRNGKGQKDRVTVRTEDERLLRPLIVVQPFFAFLFFVISNVDEVQDRVDVGGFGREIKLTG